MYKLFITFSRGLYKMKHEKIQRREIAGLLGRKGSLLEDFKLLQVLVPEVPRLFLS
jgi:hypothetical protein